MHRTLVFWTVVALVPALVVPVAVVATGCPPFAPFIGEWRGVAKALNRYVLDPLIPFCIMVDPAGTFSGRIGPVKIISGQVAEGKAVPPHLARRGGHVLVLEVEGQVTPAWPVERFRCVVWLSRLQGAVEGEIISQGIDSRLGVPDPVTYRILSWDRFGMTPAASPPQSAEALAKCRQNCLLLSRMAELYNIENHVIPASVDDLAPSIAGGVVPDCPSGGTYGWVPGTEGGEPPARQVE